MVKGVKGSRVERPKHPLFDEYWENHKGLVFFTAKKLSRKIPGFHHRYDEFVGSLTLWFNSCLYYYDPEKGKFSSYYCRKCFQYIMSHWIRWESQAWDNLVKEFQSNYNDKLDSQKSYATHETYFHLYRVPEEDQSDIDEIIDFFDGVDECWEFMTRKLDQRSKEIVSLYFKDDWTLQMIGDKFCISKERVRQLMEVAKRNIRERLRQVITFTDLFRKPEYDDESSI